MKESAEALYRVLSDLDEISRVFSSLYVYASQKYHQDMGNQKYQGYAGKMDSMMAVLADAASFVEPEILELDEETVAKFEETYEPLRLYDRVLKENFRKKEHILSPEMELFLQKPERWQPARIRFSQLFQMQTSDFHRSRMPKEIRFR